MLGKPCLFAVGAIMLVKWEKLLKKHHYWLAQSYLIILYKCSQLRYSGYFNVECKIKQLNSPLKNLYWEISVISWVWYICFCPIHYCIKGENSLLYTVGQINKGLREILFTYSGHKNSTRPIILTSCFVCRTSGNCNIYIFCNLSCPDTFWAYMRKI